MRVLVVDQDSTLLTAISRTLGEYFSIDAVTTKTDALDLIRVNEFEVIVAGERLADGSGLELLGQIARKHPQTLRIFSAERDRLRLLKGRLGPFKLFRTLPYPIQPRQLLDALSAAGGNEEEAKVTVAALEESAPARPRPAQPTRRTPSSPGRHPPVRHSTAHALASTGSRLREAKQPSAEALASASRLAIVARQKPSFATLIVASPGRNALLVGVALVAAMGLLFLALRSFNIPHRHVTPTNIPVQPGQHYPPEVVKLVHDTETAFVHDDLKAARTDIAALQQLAPDHPRLPFFESLLSRRTEAQHSQKKRPVAPPADSATGGH